MKIRSQFRSMRKRALCALLLVMLLTAVLAAPALAAKAPPATSRGSTVYTASSQNLPQGVFINGQYVRLATENCAMPMRMLMEGRYIYVCPPTVKLPSLPTKPPVILPALR